MARSPSPLCHIASHGREFQARCDATRQVPQFSISGTAGRYLRSWFNRSAAPREFDADAALDAALALFWHQGYEATSLDALTRVMDLGRSSFYGCFGSKRDTLVAAIRRYGDRRLAALEGLVAAEPDPGRI